MDLYSPCFGAEGDVEDNRGSAVIGVSGLGPVLRTFDPVVLLKVGQHYDNVDALVRKVSKQLLIVFLMLTTVQDINRMII